MNLPEWLTQDAFEYIRLRDHRIGLADIVYFFTEGDSPEMLHCRFPSVPVPLFYKTIAFYLENQKEVDAYCAEEAAAVARLRAAVQPGPSVEELRRRWEARRLSQGA